MYCVVVGSLSSSADLMAWLHLSVWLAVSCLNSVAMCAKDSTGVSSWKGRLLSSWRCCGGVLLIFVNTVSVTLAEHMAAQFELSCPCAGQETIDSSVPKVPTDSFHEGGLYSG